jgi:hypothetical protein
MTAMPFGFRVLGHYASERRPVVWRAALAGHAECDPRAMLERESYLSHFVFGPDFVEHFNAKGSERGFDGPCWAPWIYFDIDRDDDLDTALNDARRLCGTILDRYTELDDDDLLIFLSGGKGFHVGIPTSLWMPEPSINFHKVARRFAEAHAERARVAIDTMVYTKTRLFRSPNSRHPKSGLYKRRISYEELKLLSIEGIFGLAVAPEPFEVPAPKATAPMARNDERDAKAAVARRTIERRANYPAEMPRLTATTLDFIHNGADEGERAMRTFMAAANLAECGCPDPLAHGLLTRAARNSGLTPSETWRQIECGLKHGRRQREGDPS